MSWDSKRGQILTAIADRLRTMTVAGGYHWTVKAEGVKTDPENILTVPETELPVFLVEFARGQREFNAANQLESFVTVLITARAAASGLDPVRKVQLGENLLADIEKALTVDITLGGLLFDLRVQEPDPTFAGFGNVNTVIVLQEVECHWHRTYGAP